ncbi:hypothetical protein SARC_02178 [Sphaeroforma arctica JP610]|uniref:Uncharacterized protein n=1 Tax=Sphaeroforma arctica JP610 TaxID=667725 RepID=A0A0L0G9G5_9EUKA|nr:hypothetical protein SARC_02178 [Sphaeroforma arctica JP610]KNC85657.1 hypothetical protein SARC_02178 [Sphaeroforma arctica JP610]|eukprot:XP_014159559.1 hypothetical protein SARC_02178 [Sphaeroforma arctica JP610]
MAQQNRTERITTPSDVDFTEQGLGTPEAMGAARLATQNHLQATATVRVGVNNTTGRRHQKYDRRLQRLRRSTTLQTSDNLKFRIRGADQSRRGLGYTSSDQEGSEAPQDKVSLHDFVQEQHRAQENPHGREALDNRRDNMEASLHTRRQGRQFEQETLSHMLPAQRMLELTPSSQSVSADKRRRLDQQYTPPTPESIAADRQALHARMFKLSEELCSAVEANSLPRAEALRGMLETLRAKHDSRPTNKQEPREPRSWLEWSSNRYNLSNIMERDTKGALREALKNAQISGLGFYKVLSHFKAEQYTLEYIKSNHQRLVAWTPELQITQVCSHETQATVDPTFRKLAKGHLKISNVPVMEQMTYLMDKHRRAHERCQTDAEFKQNLLHRSTLGGYSWLAYI